VDKFLDRILAPLLLLILSINVNAKQIATDPTRPGIVLIKTDPTIIKKTVKRKRLLSAIFIKQGKRQAIINDKLYQQGDYFFGKKIIVIKSNKVVLQNSSGVSHLTLINPIKNLKNP